MHILQLEAISIMDLNPYFGDSYPLPCFSFFRMSDSNLVVGDSNPFLFSTFCFSFALGDSNSFVEDMDPLALSTESSLLH